MTNERFWQLHYENTPLLLPNPWDIGSARLLASLGFTALATTSWGFAATLGRPDGSVTREEALQHAADIVGATDLPVSADLENGFADSPEEVAQTVTDAVAVGLAGCSIEDFTGNADAPSYEHELAIERVRAAAEAAHAGGNRFVLTARCEHFLHGRDELADVIARLQAFQEAGADVLYAPGLVTPADIAAVVGAVERPVNVLLMATTPSVAELGGLGVARISIGGTFANAAMGAVVEAAREFREHGTVGFFERAAVGRSAAQTAFAPR